MRLLVVLVVLIALVIIVNTRSTRVYVTNDKGFVDRGILTKQACEELVSMAKKYPLETKNDGVDDKPEYQVDIIARGIDNPELWEKARGIYLKKLRPIMDTLDWIPDGIFLRYIFLRRYEKNQRSHIPLHLDENYLTMSILLSDTKDFDGGELYVFDRDTSREIEAWRVKENTTTEDDDAFIRQYTPLPVLAYRQGDVAVYTGGDNCHGTLPITRGERYILTFFFK